MDNKPQKRAKRFQEREPLEKPTSLPLRYQTPTPEPKCASYSLSIAPTCRYTRLPAKRAQGASVWRNRGGFITVSGGNGLGIVPRAYLPNNVTK